MSDERVSDLLIPPGYCQYAGGPCEERFDDLDARGVFFLYASHPAHIADTIEQAAAKHRDAVSDEPAWGTWRDLPIPGQIIFTEICKGMRGATTVAADVTTLNFNVLFEIGFALGLGLSVVPIRDLSYVRDKREFEELGLLDVLGYVEFSNHDNLFERLAAALPRPPLSPVSSRFFLESPLYLVKDPYNTSGLTRLISVLDKARLNFRSFDPVEVPRLSLHEARRQVAGSAALIAHLVDPEREGSIPFITDAVPF